jgi:hypothetical protein
MKRLILFFALITLSAFLSYGQEVTGEIIGKVTLAEDGTPLPGVTVTLSGQTYGRMDYITTAEGNYRFWKLPPGNYELRFELQGFKTVIRSAIRVNVLSTRTVDVAMEPGAIEEEVTVIGQVPLIDTRKTKVAASFTADEVVSLPVARRTSEIVNLAPGTLSAHPQIAGQGSGVIHGFGVRFQLGEFSLDGASFRSTYGASGMPTGVNTIRVEETQVTTSGQDISNVQGGATVNFVTKRGGNRLAGEAFLAYMAKALQSEKALPANMGPKPATGADPAVTYLGYTKRSGVYRTYEYGAALGGPIFQDHLWFFGSWAVTDPMSQNYYGIPSSRYYQPDMYGKISFQWKKTTAEVSYAHTDSLALNDQWFSNAPNNLDRLNPYNTYTAQATQTLWNKFLLSAKLTYFSGKTQTHQANLTWTGAGDVSYDEGRTYNPPGRYYTYNYFKNPPYNTEATGHWQHYGDAQKRPYWVLEANYFAESFLGGDHEVKIGVDRNYSRFIEEYMAPNQLFVQARPWSQQTTVENNAPSVSAFGNYWGYMYTYCDRYGEKRAERTGVYFQDVMSYGRLTLNIGARMDWHAVATDPVTYHAFRPADTDVTNGQWEQWTGVTKVEASRVTVDPTFSPRLSLSYDLFGNGKDFLKFMYADYGGMFESGIRISAYFKPGNTRGEFYLPFIDYNNNWVPDFGTSEMFFLDWFGRWPTPADIQTVKEVTQAEKAALEAQYGVGKVPWNAWTYPGNMYVNFVGNPLGNKATGLYPRDFMLDSYTPEKIREIMLSYEKMLTTDMSVQVMLAYKKNYNLQWSRGYTGSYTGTDSSVTLLPNDTSIKVGTDPTTGWDIYQRDSKKYPNPSGYAYDAYKNTYNDFRGIELIFTKRFSHGWMLQASGDFQDWRYHQDKGEVGMSTLFDYYQDAPYQAYQYRSTEPGQNSRWHFKISGLYQLPFLGINLSGFIDAREGYPINGKWITAYLGQSLPAKGDKYGDYRMPNLWYMNLTLEKAFKFSENVTSTVYITGYNVTDNMTTTMINEAKVPTTLDQPSDVMKPRVFQVGIRFSFR